MLLGVGLYKVDNYDVYEYKNIYNLLLFVGQ